MGRIEEAKDRYEKSLLIYEKLLETDPENVAYQSNVAMTLNNLGVLLSKIGSHRRCETKVRKGARNETRPPRKQTQKMHLINQT